MVRPILSKGIPLLFVGLMVGFLILGVLSSTSTPLAAGAAAPSQYVTPPPPPPPSLLSNGTFLGLVAALIVLLVALVFTFASFVRLLSTARKTAPPAGDRRRRKE